MCYEPNAYEAGIILWPIFFNYYIKLFTISAFQEIFLCQQVLIISGQMLGLSLRRIHWHQMISPQIRECHLLNPFLSVMNF